MTNTGIHSIDHAPQAVAEWLDQICDRLDWTDNRRAYLLLRTVLHGLRDWLNVDEAADLAAQLPLLLRGIYFEGWNPSSTPVHPRKPADFLERMNSTFKTEPLEDTEQAVAAVFAILDGHISKGEANQVRQSLQKGLRDLWPH
jgi:uncharacterized protein (DUF2267 family)